LSSPLKRKPREVNVLFTSAGRRVELLRAFQRAFRSLRLRGKIHVTDVDPLAPAFQTAVAAHRVPKLTDPEYVPALLEIARAEKISLVFPLIDPDIPILAAHRAEFEALGARVMTPDAAGAATADDKWKTFLLYREIGVPAARSWLPEDVRRERPGFPLFIKPRTGSAGQGAFRVEDERQLEFFLTYVENAIVQECLPGPEITNDVLCSASGGVWSVVSRRRIEVRSGEVAKGVTVWDERIAQFAAAAAGAIHAAGPVTVQCILRDGDPFFTEINARFGGGCPLGIKAGADSPRWYLAEAAGLPLKIPPLGTYKENLVMTRFDDSFFLDPEHDQE
jgi:carbamoyl-phosphate synthase large subunit